MLNPWQPALISSLNQIAIESKKAGIYSGVCGESGSDPAFAVVLAGMGYDSVSSSRSQVGAVRTALSSVSKDEARAVFESVAAASDSDEAKTLALAKLGEIAK
jgi:phosphotransferase system enzyme I (PtsI)